MTEAWSSSGRVSIGSPLKPVCTLPFLSWKHFFTDFEQSKLLRGSIGALISCYSRSPRLRPLWPNLTQLEVEEACYRFPLARVRSSWSRTRCWRCRRLGPGLSGFPPIRTSAWPGNSVNSGSGFARAAPTSCRRRRWNFETRSAVFQNRNRRYQRRRRPWRRDAVTFLRRCRRVGRFSASGLAPSASVSVASVDINILTKKIL